MQRIPSLLRRLLPALALCAAAIAPGIAQAAYPEQPIKMVVAYAPGGGTDIIARLTAQYMQKYLGNNASFVVLNRPGAGGGIGFTELTNAQPDGYTDRLHQYAERAHHPDRAQGRTSTGRSTTCSATSSTTRATSRCMPTARSRAWPSWSAYAKANPGDGHLWNHGHRFRRPPRRADVRACGRREADARAVQGRRRSAQRHRRASRSWWRR